jgi:aldose 1-epimerase
MTVTRSVFGSGPGGETIHCYAIANENGYAMSCMELGATLISFIAPDLSGEPVEITLGYDSLAPYLEGHPFFGSTIGRVANRIGKATFTLDEQLYTLTPNEGANLLHSGSDGFHVRLWSSEPFQSTSQAGVLFSLRSPDGDQGFPGALDVTVSMSLTESNELLFEYRAEAEEPTPVNLTNHAYWNLAGAPDCRNAPERTDRAGGDIGNHLLMIPSHEYAELDEENIPTGSILPVAGTAFDFRTPKPIGADIELLPNGYDLSYGLEPTDGVMRQAAVVEEDTTGRRMEIATTSPAIQFYTGNYLDGTPARGGHTHHRYSAFCLETQFHPDTVNHPDFPSIIVKPGHPFEHRTIHRFSVT